MTHPVSQSQVLARRGELLAELLLQELGAEFIARPAADLGYDFFVGFGNPEGGVNLAAVEVKATERPVRSPFAVDRRLFRRLANSNIPVVLLVADVKENRLYYAIPTAHGGNGHAGGNTVSLPLTAVDDTTRSELRDQLANAPANGSLAAH
ncbi:MAG TPA: DUF4365 domain-containing protein [Longimicrobium sp.]|nr:DUF4365 domain-containing protein [Longimicrobium sp.]